MPFGSICNIGQERSGGIWVRANFGENFRTLFVSNFQRKTPWGDKACADCPGFLVLGAAIAPASTFVSEPEIVPLG